MLSRDKKRNDSSRLIALLIAAPSSIPSARRRKPLPRPFPWRRKSRKRVERDSLIIFTGGERWLASSAAILTWLPRSDSHGKNVLERRSRICIIFEIHCCEYFKRENCLEIIVFWKFWIDEFVVERLLSGEKYELTSFIETIFDFDQ